MVLDDVFTSLFLKICVSYIFSLINICITPKMRAETRVDLPVKCCKINPILTNIGIRRYILLKKTRTKFYEF
jgi:hypothetical protein